MLTASLLLLARIGAEPSGLEMMRVRCTPPPYEVLRVRRLPGVAATTSKPRNPLEDAYPPCVSMDGGSAQPAEPGVKKRPSPQNAPARR